MIARSLKCFVVAVVFWAALSGAGPGKFPVWAGGVVGTGTPASCTEAELNAALTGGGMVTFNCGPTLHTIVLNAQKVIATDTALDGGGTVALGGNGSRHFVVNDGATLRITSLTLRNG